MRKISTLLLVIVMLLTTSSVVSRVMGKEVNASKTTDFRESVNVLPDAPLSIEINDVGFDSLSLSVTGNTNGDQILIALTDKTQGLEDLYPTEDGVFGTPEGLLDVGDKIPGGGTVVYKGKAGADIKIHNLKDNTVYHLAVWSVNAQNVYSSSCVKANGITLGKLPFRANFENTPLYNTPLGWVITGRSLCRVARRSLINLGEEQIQLETTVEVGNPYTGVENTVTTQWIRLNDAVNRVLFKHNFTVESRMGPRPYNWVDKDTLYVQISNNDKDYTTVHTLHAGNYVPGFSDLTVWGAVNAPFDLFRGEKVKIRLKWKTFSSDALKMLIERFVVEEKPDCEYPVNVHVKESSIIEGKALIGWTANDDEASWEIRYRKVEDENWSKTVESETNSYLLTNLPSNATIEVQVRTKCSPTSVSPWSEAVSFKSNYSIPFTENFNNINILPVGWSFKNGLLGSPTEFLDGIAKKWSLISGKLTIPLRLKLRDWVITPKIDLGDGSYHGKLVFDLELSGNSDGSIDENICFAVVVSTDGTFNKEDVILELKQADFAAIGNGKQYSIDLSRFKGVIQLGFYAYSQFDDADEILSLDNISVLETCPSATNANVSRVTPVSAIIGWDDTAEEWLTFVRKAGEISKEYTRQAESVLALTGLSPKTNYEVGITKSCNVGDTAKVVIVPLLTASCFEPADIVATPTKKDVTISWTGEASNYNVKLRKKNSEDWIVKTTQETRVVFEDLQENRVYEYALQSVCSTEEGDMSEWTDILIVMTLPETCLPPTQIVAEPTYKSARITWEGEADKYQLAYKAADAWMAEEMVAGKEFTMNGLIADSPCAVRLRSICAVGDTSSWSAVTEFKTAQIPECASPTNLKATGITDTKVTLEWSADEGNLSWDVRYCLAGSDSWMTFEKLKSQTFEVIGLTPNTAYVWGVKASCDEGRTSAWVPGTLTTKPGTGIHNLASGSIKVYISNKVLNIQNPGNVKIERVSLYGTDGKCIKNFPINSDENVMIPLNLDSEIVIVKVTGDSFTEFHTIYID